MRNLKYSIIIVALLSLLTFKANDIIAGSSSSTPNPTITEEDLIPSGKPRVIKFSNGSVTYNLDGSASVTTGGGGGLTAESNDMEDSAVGIQDTEIVIGTGANTANYTTVTGDISLTNAGVTALQSSAISGQTVTGTIDSADTFLILDSASGALRQVNASNLPAGAEVNDLETACQDIASTEIPIGTIGGGTALYAPLSGDVSMINDGTVTVADDSHDHTNTTITLASTDLSDSTTIGNNISWQDLSDSATIDADTVDGEHAAAFADALHASTHRSDGADSLVFGGDVTGGYESTVVGDDSHAHTNTTITLASTDLTDSTTIDADTLDGLDSTDFADSTLSNVTNVQLNSTDLADSATINALTLNGFTSDDFADSTHAAEHEVGGSDLVGHDNLTGFVADEHIAHSGVTLTAGTALSGGGTIAANRTFNIDFLEQAVVEADAADTVLIYDVSTSSYRRTSLADLVTAGGGGIAINPGDYDSGWFTASNATLYTKAHGLTISFPDDLIWYEIWWRVSSSGNEIFRLNLAQNDDNGSHAHVSYNGTNIYLKNQGYWGGYETVSGVNTWASGGELRIISWDLE